MHRSLKRKPKKGQPHAPTVLSRADKWKIVALVSASVSVYFGVGFVTSKNKHARHIESTLARWRVTYHLDDDQVRQIRSMEMQFHADWSLFKQTVHTPAENYQHLLAISRVMLTEDAANFMKNQEGARAAADPPH